jgi:hypothetical protein
MIVVDVLSPTKTIPVIFSHQQKRKLLCSPTTTTKAFMKIFTKLFAGIRGPAHGGMHGQPLPGLLGALGEQQ